MEFKKKTHKYLVDEQLTKYITKYESPSCSPEDSVGNIYKIELLKFVVNNYNNLDYNSKIWQKAIISHNGTAWEIALETVVEEKNI